VQDLIEDELRAVLADWNAGKEIRTLALGHSTRVEGLKDGFPLEVRNSFRQRHAVQYVFQLIEAGLRLKMPFPYSAFFSLCLDQRHAVNDLSREEIDAAESLAWKALLRGWNVALTGFPDSRYISIAKEKEKPAA
jgi:hypothetical protein